MSYPNEFSFLPEDVLVIVVMRNAIDWAVSLYNQPWFAALHCNVTFHEFLTKEWSYGNTSRQDRPPPFCHKYEAWTPESSYSSNMYYEDRQGRFAKNVLELRAWKLQRQLQVCNTRRQVACLRYEDAGSDWKGWLEKMRRSLNLRVREGYPVEVSSYKGEREMAKYKRKSHLENLKMGTPSPFYTPEVMGAFSERLESQWERRAGFDYAGVL
ncbi:hypothetical protein WJX73_006468 [Symbiochloris irregularis]|uniref:Sulfotransferase n=1 Tax=Symbiochloris irregularis TaxID=706552 RepID=A0AAW1PHX4_9CHLO